jgi:hypothetical protein
VDSIETDAERNPRRRQRFEYKNCNRHGTQSQAKGHARFRWGKGQRAKKRFDLPNSPDYSPTSEFEPESAAIEGAAAEQRGSRVLTFS